MENDILILSVTILNSKSNLYNYQDDFTGATIKEISAFIKWYGKSNDSLIKDLIYSDGGETVFLYFVIKFVLYL